MIRFTCINTKTIDSSNSEIRFERNKKQTLFGAIFNGKEKKQHYLITDLYLIYFMIPNITITYLSMIFLVYRTYDMPSFVT